MGTCETSHRAEPHRCSHRLLSDASPSRQHAKRGVNPPRFDSEVLPVLVDPGTKTGRAHGERHQGSLNALIAPPGWPSTTLSVLSREAVPALFGVLKLRQYLCSHVRMTLLVWMHVECVPICLVQIDLDRVNIGREGFAL